MSLCCCTPCHGKQKEHCVPHTPTRLVARIPWIRVNGCLYFFACVCVRLFSPYPYWILPALPVQTVVLYITPSYVLFCIPSSTCSPHRCVVTVHNLCRLLAGTKRFDNRAVQQMLCVCVWVCVCVHPSFFISLTPSLSLPPYAFPPFSHRPAIWLLVFHGPNTCLSLHFPAVEP